MALYPYSPVPHGGQHIVITYCKFTKISFDLVLKHAKQLKTMATILRKLQTTRVVMERNTIRSVNYLA